MQASTNPFAANPQQQYGTGADQSYGMSMKSFEGENQLFSPDMQKTEESLLGSQMPPPAYPLPIQGQPGYQAIMSLTSGQKHYCPLCDIVDVIHQEEPHSVPQKISTPRQAMFDLCCHFYCGNTCLVISKFWRSKLVWKALCYPLAVIVLIVIIATLLSV